MASTLRPQGLKAAFHPSGVIRPTARSLASGYPANLFKGTPVLINANGLVEVAGATGAFAGVFIGVEFTDGEGRRRVSNRWLANTVASDIVVWVIEDPSVIYEIQANGSVTQARVGEQANLANAGNGNTVTGISEAVLGTGSFTNSGNAQLRVRNIAPGPDNAAGDAFTVVHVEIAQHQFRADRAAF